MSDRLWFRLDRVERRLEAETDLDLVDQIYDALAEVGRSPRDPEEVRVHRFHAESKREWLVAWLPGGYYLKYEARDHAPMPWAGPCIYVLDFAHLSDLAGESAAD